MAIVVTSVTGDRVVNGPSVAPVISGAAGRLSFLSLSRRRRRDFANNYPSGRCGRTASAGPAVAYSAARRGGARIEATPSASVAEIVVRTM